MQISLKDKPGRKQQKGSDEKRKGLRNAWIVLTFCTWTQDGKTTFTSGKWKGKDVPEKMLPERVTEPT